MSALTPSEVERYARHLVLPEVGGAGQQKLKKSRVLVVGAGGLGAPVISYLAAAGVGTIGIADNDIVSLSNLQRQIIHGVDSLGTLKVQSALQAVKMLNPEVSVEAHPVRISAENALKLLGAYDIIADGSDNFDTRYLVSDACFFAKRPLVTAAASQFDGSLTLLKPYEEKAGQKNPTYRCLFPNQPSAGSIRSCEQAGVMGVLTGVLGSLQAMEIIKELLGIGEGLVGKLLLYDGLGGKFSTLKYGWSSKNPLTGTSQRYADLSHHPVG